MDRYWSGIVALVTLFDHNYAANLKSKYLVHVKKQDPYKRVESAQGISRALHLFLCDGLEAQYVDPTNGK